MIDEIASVRAAGKALAATVLLGFALTATVVPPTDVLAQTKPAETKKPAAKPAPKPAQAQPQAQAAPPAASDQQPHLMYSPWIKICNKNQQDPNAKEVCVTAKDGRLENGMPVAAVALIEPKGVDKKLIRVTVPLGMQLQHGTRMIIDQEQPLQAPYFMCFPNGCMADYEASNDLINKLKKGKQLTVQAINMHGTPISLPLPLADFAKAHDGPPTDPKVFEEQQRKLQEELQKKAEEARKKLQAQPQGEAPKQ
jgi:invasion protein IalB